MVYLTEQQRIDILIMTGCGNMRRNQQEVCRLFNEKYPDIHIRQSTISKILKKYREHGNVKNLPKTGRKSVLSEDNKLNIALALQEYPHTSLNNLAKDEPFHASSIYRFLKKEHYYPYKVCYVQELLENDPEKRLQFCENMMRFCDQIPNFIQNIIFTDEATFVLNGEVNKQNYRHWSQTNPHWIIENNTQYPQKVNVWMGMINSRILGPYFFEGNLNADTYLDFLSLELIPALVAVFPNHDDPDIPQRQIWFQQDGAPPHFGRRVRQYLNEVFPNKWIGRGGPVEWPPRSPDLSPLDYFLWGYLKENVYKIVRPQNLEDLKERIRTVARSISPVIIQDTIQHFYDRLGFCQIVTGDHFEHLLRQNVLFN